MSERLQPKVIAGQELIVRRDCVTIGSMNREAHEFSLRLNAVLDEHGFPRKGAGRQGLLGKRFGISQNGARKWLEGDGMPKHSRINEIAKAFSVNAEWLITGRGPKHIGEPQQITEPPASYLITPNFQSLKKLPLISYVQAGQWSEAVDEFEPGDAKEWRETTATVGNRAFMLKVFGDSMVNPNGLSIPEGSIIVVDPDTPAENGKIVVAKLTESNEVTLKKLVIDGPNKYLKPLNPAYRMIEINGNCEIVGVVKKVEIDL